MLKSLLKYKRGVEKTLSPSKEDELRKFFQAASDGCGGDQKKLLWFLALSTQETSIGYLVNRWGAGYSGMYWSLIRQEMRKHNVHPASNRVWCWKNRYTLTQWGASVFCGFVEKYGYDGAVKTWVSGEWWKVDAKEREKAKNYLKEVKKRRAEILTKVSRFDRAGKK